MAAEHGWYPDPERKGMLRWWNGEKWLDQWQPGTEPLVDTQEPGGIGAPAPSPAHRGGLGCGGCLGIVVIIALCFGVVAGVASAITAANQPGPEEMMGECVAQVATWAAVDPAQITAVDISDQNFSGKAWDFSGTYPGGDWGCGGPENTRIPAQIMVYPGGRGALLEDNLPRQIYP